MRTPTALARRTERGGHNVTYGLFWQRGRVDDHGIEPAGLGDQWVAASRYSAMDRLIRLAVCIDR